MMSSDDHDPGPPKSALRNITARDWLIIACTTLLIIMLIDLIPPPNQGAEAARRARCKNNLKHIGLALHQYHDKFGSFPPPASYDSEGRPLLSWRVLILPCIDLPGMKELFAEFHLDEPWDSAHNLPLAEKMPDVYRCPSDSRHETTTGYVAAVGVETYFPPHTTVCYADATDGGALTGMVGELQSSTIVWTRPEDLDFNDRFIQSGGFSSAHKGGWQMLMGDGTVRFASENIDRSVYRAIMTIAGGERIDEDNF